MPYAVELYFDQATEIAIRHIWQTISGAGFKAPMLDAGYRPHVSLGVYDSDYLDLDNLQQTLVAYAESMTSFFLDFSNIGIFPTAENVVFLGVTVTQKLQDVHAGFHAAFESFSAKLRPYYQVGNWVPHCTLSYGLTAKETAAVIPLCWQMPLPLRTHVQEIGIAKVSNNNCRFIFQLNLDAPGIR